jgi:protein-S-isoprenylcysteine O-methyltransferase Ste14
MNDTKTLEPTSAPMLARIPPPIWVIVYIVAAIALSEWVAAPPIAVLHQPLIGAILIVSALALIISAQIKFRSAGTEIMPTSPTNKALVTNGPYGITRNPMYLGLVALTLGIAFMVGTIFFFVVPLVVFLTNNASVIPFEEAKMERQFGDQYRAYKAKVRRWI